MYELILQETFAAAHRLPLSGGKCERLHGHNWKVEVRVWSDTLNQGGMVIDFHDLRQAVLDVLKEFDHTFLNEHSAFQDESPTAENLARYIYENVAALLASQKIQLSRVCVWESETTAAVYTQPTT